MDKQEILERLESAFSKCLNEEKNPTYPDYYHAYCYGMLKESVRSILKENDFWKYDKKGNEINDKESA